ncbi:hypothetical protein D0T49_03585 [Paludibacter sp. 221]|uniref:hypothetical protein n=1 Tax=Paludibacter sp. 221 TaxID=2302939 RepID=UPI0013D47C8E|nr:hypothetical protein [Paludibacter sp. 221]NDV46122.1 hypothetical protein [Paludibacter sp. 221]
MKEFNGTQGKWESVEIDLADYKQVSIGSGEKIICHLHIENEISDEVKANAQLIATAPELLDKCIELRKQLDTIITLYGCHIEAKRYNEITAILTNSFKVINESIGRV